MKLLVAALALACSVLLPIAAQAKPAATIFTASFCGGNGLADTPDHCDHCLAGADRIVGRGPDSSLALSILEEPLQRSAPGSFHSVSHLPAQSRGPPAIL